MIFDYKAVSAEGRMTYGRLDAINLIDLEMRLKRMNLDLVTGHPIQHKSLFGPRGVPRPGWQNRHGHRHRRCRWRSAGCRSPT